jgi:hypothetical protein
MLAGQLTKSKIRRQYLFCVVTLKYGFFKKIRIC